MARRRFTPRPDWLRATDAWPRAGYREGAPVHAYPSPAETTAVLAVVGESPGPDERVWGYPFIGASGVELDRYLEELVGLDRADVFTTNVYRNVTAKGDPDEDARNLDLLDELAQVQPSYVAALGRHAINALVGWWPGFDDDGLDVHQVHGVPFTADLGWGDVVVVPCFHPAAGLRSVDLQPHVAHDFRVLGRIVRGEWTGALTPVEDAYPDPQYWDIATTRHLPFARTWPCIAVDTEGSEADPQAISWTGQPGMALVAWREPDEAPRQAPMIARALTFLRDAKRANPDFLLLLHNAMHDIAVLRAFGLDLVGEGFRFVDTMVLAYHQSIEPQGLKPLAWRHAGMTMRSYAEMVGPATQQKTREYLARVAADTTLPKPEGRVDILVKAGDLVAKLTGGQSPAARAKGILRDVDAKKRDKEGRLVDPFKRWRQVEPHVRAIAEDRYGVLEMATLYDIDRRDATHYAARDADATFRIYPHLVARQTADLRRVSQLDHEAMPIIERMQTNGLPIDRAGCRALAVDMSQRYIDILDTIHSYLGYYINPNSDPQVRQVMEDFALASTKRTKTGRASTQKKVIEGLKGDHPVIGLVVQARETKKVWTSFALPLGYQTDPPPPAQPNRARSNLRVTRTSSGRLAASKSDEEGGVNLMAVPVRSAVGRRVRAQFRVQVEGRVLSTFDLDQVEMRCAAHISKDPNLCRLFIEGADIHSQTAAKIFGIRVEDVDAKRHRAPAKRVGFGVLNAITAPGLLDQMRMEGQGAHWDVESCQQMIDEWFKLYHGVQVMMSFARAEAIQRECVTDMWGRVRWLPGARSRNPWVREEAFRQASNHKIQGGAQGLIKRAMAGVWGWLREEWRARPQQYLEPLLQIHDELLFEHDEAAWPMVQQEVVRYLTAPRDLDGTPVVWAVPIRAKGVMGRTWADLEK